MEKYKVVIEKPAEHDLFGILDYIDSVLHEPQTAKRIYGSLKAQVLSLAEMPLRYAAVREEPYRTAGVRRMPVENYSVFYLADEASRTVHVIRVLYSRREWQNLL